MIIEMKFDTEYQPDQERVMTVFKALGLEKAPVVTSSSIMETARRRSAGENVVYREEAPAPKKRGRKPRIVEDKNV